MRSMHNFLLYPVMFNFQDFDRILSILNNLHEIYTDEDGPAIVFNCELGKGRTTTGMAIAALIYCNKKVNMWIYPSLITLFHLLPSVRTALLY